MEHNPQRIAVLGGAGHIGLPLALLLAKARFDVVVVDIDQQRIEMLRRGEFPFLEEGGPELLQDVKGNHLRFTTEVSAIADCEVVILVTGTPVDEYLSPDLGAVFGVIDQITPQIHDGQVLIMCSTLFPGTTERIHLALRAAGLDVHVSCCPERTVQGKALDEMPKIPQIISGCDETAVRVAREVFSAISSDVIELSVAEAELGKLFTNASRYIKFAIANQFYMIAAEKGLDYERIRRAFVDGYERGTDLSPAGFTAGPCLFKDTMQLAAYDRRTFTLGHAGMLVNETLPDFLVERLKLEGPLAGRRIGILGMAFKADVDDVRDSLSYKLKKLLRYENAQVMCSDPYVQDDDCYPLEDVLTSSEVIILACPHSVYKDLNLDGKRVVDVWGLTLER